MTQVYRMPCPICSHETRRHCAEPRADCHWRVCFGCGLIVDRASGRWIPVSRAA